MAYAVMQTSLDTLSVDVLQRAFRGVPGLAAYDAFTLGKDAFGILVKGFELEPATKLVESLAAQGVPAQVLDETALPQLPEVQFLGRLDCTPEALVLYDQLGRTASLEWKDIALIAAGRVMMTEFKELQKPVPNVLNSTGSGVLDELLSSRNAGFGLAYGTLPTSDYTVDVRTREERHERCILEIIPTGAAVRYSVNADKSLFQLFHGLGDRRTNDLRRNFTLLVQDIIRGAPEAAINRGAYYLRENASTPFVYPSKQSFYSEIVWLLWMMNKQQTST